MKVRAQFSLAILSLAVPACAANYLDIAPFAQLSTWGSTEPRRLADIRSAGSVDNIGLEWDEERDSRKLRVQYPGEPPKGATVEYWFNAWPGHPPTLPSI